MNLFILRHGIAVEGWEFKGPDRDRWLTPKGKKRTRAVCEVLRSDKRIQPDRILSSPYLRARETADIAGDVFLVPVEVCDILACGYAPSELMPALRSVQDAGELNVMVVGHEPDCSGLTAWLTGTSAFEIEFKKAGCSYCSGTPEQGGMELVWLTTPKSLGVVE